MTRGIKDEQFADARQHRQSDNALIGYCNRASSLATMRFRYFPNRSVHLDGILSSTWPSDVPCGVPTLSGSPLILLVFPLFHLSLRRHTFGFALSILFTLVLFGFISCRASNCFIAIQTGVKREEDKAAAERQEAWLWWAFCRSLLSIGALNQEQPETPSRSNMTQ